MRVPTPTRAQLLLQHRSLALAAIVCSLLLFVDLGGVRASSRPAGLVIASALGAALIAGAALYWGLSRGRSMLGRPRAGLFALAVLTPLLLFTWRTLVSSFCPQMMVEWPERPGLRCLLLSAVLASAPLLAAFWARRGSDPIHPYSQAAALGAGVGASAWVLVDLWCPVGYLPHLLLGHLLPLVLLITLSTVLGGRVLALRRLS